MYHGVMGDLEHEQFLEEHRSVFQEFSDLRITLEELPSQVSAT